MKKNTKRVLGFVLSIALGVLAAVGLDLAGRQAVQASLPAAVSRTGLRLELYSADGQEELHLWEDAAGTLHAFLPGWAQPGQIMVCALEPGQRFSVDGVGFRDSGFYDLTPGGHTVQFRDGNSKQLIVHQGAPDMASLFVQTDSGSIEYVHAQKGNEEGGSYQLFDPVTGSRWAGRMELRGRSNSNWSDAEKRSYRLKLEEAADLFGMGRARRWVLMPNGKDPSGLRNHIVYELARDVGMNYVTETRFVELYLNGEYRGVYQLCEKVEVGPDRVDIRDLQKEMDALNPGLDFDQLPKQLRGYWGEPFTGMFCDVPGQPEDLTGGYLLEMDLDVRYGGEPSGFISKNLQHVVVAAPKYATGEQVDYIRILYQRMEDAVWSESGLDPITLQPFSDFMDMTSFAQKFLVEEIVKNYESRSSSQFLYKPDDSVSTKLHIGPVWDYDFALCSGRDDGIEEVSAMLREPEGFYLPPTDFLLGKLYQHQEFRDAVIGEYYDHFLPEIRTLIDWKLADYAEQLLPSAMMDAVRWDLWPQAGTDAERENAYLEEVDVIRRFLDQRTAWLCEQWPEPLA